MIKTIKLGQTGLEGVNPRWVYLETTDTYADILATGYLNGQYRLGYFFKDTDIAVVNVRETPDATAKTVIMQVKSSGNDWSLQALSNMPQFVGRENDGGGDATIAITVAGVTADMDAMVQVRASTNDVSVEQVITSADTITVQLSGDPGAATVLTYVVYNSL